MSPSRASKFRNVRGAGPFCVSPSGVNAMYPENETPDPPQEPEPPETPEDE